MIKEKIYLGGEEEEQEGKQNTDLTPPPSSPPPPKNRTMTQTHKQLYLQKMQRIAQMVMDITGISQENYNKMRFEKGIEYLQKVTEDKTKSKLLSESPLFWGFWVNEWIERDTKWIDYYESHFLSMTTLSGVQITEEEGVLAQEYSRFHDLKTLSKSLIIPQKLISLSHGKRNKSQSKV